MKVLAIVVEEDATVPLDRWLATKLTAALGRPVARGLVRSAIARGVVAFGGRVVRDPGLRLRKGPSIFVRNFDWLPARAASAALRVLYEDDFLVVVDKPEGLPTHETRDRDRPSLTAAVEAHLGRRVFVHHRLDAATSGVVLFAKAKEANKALAQGFAGKEIEKTYIALTARPPGVWPARMTIESPLLTAPNGTVGVDPRGVPARTEVRLIERGPDSLLIEARPLTGRKHQIRVHLASMGAPIVGDSRYGGPHSEAGRMMLHAERIALEHPVTGRPLTIVSPWPPAFALKRSTQELRRESGPPPGSAGAPLRPRALQVPGKTGRKKKEPRKPGPGSGRDSRR